MEKITINSIEQKTTKTNVPFWAVTYNGGQKATIWDAVIAGNIKMGVEGVGEVSIKGNFSNIRALSYGSVEVTNPDNTIGHIEVNPSLKKEKPNPQRVGLYIKMAVEMMVAAPTEGKNVEENLVENVQEIKRLEDFIVKLLE